jgi:hypothetical protein
MIDEVLLWTDDSRVTVFNERGHGMPEYSGHIGVVATRILRDAPPTAKFYLTNLATSEKHAITRQQFTSLSSPFKYRK